GETGQEGDFVGFQLLFGDVLVEIDLGGHFDAADLVSEVDVIEVGFEDFVLGVTAFQVPGDQRLLDFPAQFFVPVLQDGVPCDLHGDGPAALHRAHGEEVAHRRPPDAFPIHAVVFVKAPGFDGDKGLDQQIGLDVLQLDVFEVGVAELDHFFILPVIQGGGEVHLFHRFQIVNAAGQEDGGTASGNQKQGGGQYEEPPFFPHAF